MSESVQYRHRIGDLDHVTRGLIVNMKERQQPIGRNSRKGNPIAGNSLKKNRQL